MASGQAPEFSTGEGGITVRSRMRILVAVDFGTTFSAVAYANTRDWEPQKMLTSWGDGGGRLTQENVPTILSYDNGGTTGAYVWGFRAQKHLDKGKKVHEWFKLGLCNDFEERRARESELMRKYKSHTALEPVVGKDCEDVVVHYLSGIKGAVDKFFNARDEEVARCPRDYIITVPALWDHAEQEKTRRCAERAGMGEGTHLQIISEPEAACIYAIQTKLMKRANDTYVICDAGGGTVDLASYTIESLTREPFHCKLAGAAIGSGGLCGSTFLNRIFEEYLRKKLRGYPGWDEAYMIEAMKAFENTIKPEFTGESADYSDAVDSASDELHITIRGLEPSNRHGVEMNTLILTIPELREHVFDEVITKVQGLVRDQIANTRVPVKGVLLAGGFGNNLYLLKKLQEIDSVVHQRITVEQIENSDTAIARGALIAGLAGLGRIDEREDDGGFNAHPTRPIITEVVSRISGRHYGTAAYFPFVEGMHEEERRLKRVDGDKIEQIQWFANRGESIPDGEPRSFDFSKLAKVGPGVVAHDACTPNVRIFTCEENDPAEYIDDPCVQEIAQFKLDLQGLDIPIIRQRGMQFYEANFVIEMTLRAASLEFCGVYGKGTAKEKRFQANQVRFR